MEPGEDIILHLTCLITHIRDRRREQTHTIGMILTASSTRATIPESLEIFKGTLRLQDLIFAPLAGLQLILLCNKSNWNCFTGNKWETGRVTKSALRDKNKYNSYWLICMKSPTWVALLSARLHYSNMMRQFHQNPAALTGSLPCGASVSDTQPLPCVLLSSNYSERRGLFCIWIMVCLTLLQRQPLQPIFISGMAMTAWRRASGDAEQWAPFYEFVLGWQL